jgi:Ca2+/H+ antiporter, TMEM165/GDT1 family
MMAGGWTHAGASAVAAFLASSVEGVEALTVVLAVGFVRGWRGSLTGAGLGLVALMGLTAAVGPALTRVPLDIIRVVVGGLLLLFGLRWLRKAILRRAGIIPLHDEGAAYADETESLRRVGGVGGTLAAFDTFAIATSFKIVILEGIEVVFIILAIGAEGGLLVPAVVGAVAALVLVIALGFALHRPLAAVPENELKFVVGVLLTAFGTFWTGEGIGVAWPGAELSLLALTAGFLAIACLSVRAARVAAGPITLNGKI